LIENNNIKEFEKKLPELLNIMMYQRGLTKNNVKNEPEILCTEGTFRPDRVITNGDTVTLVEFKTGKENKIHKEQIKKYSEILKNAGYNNIESYILYLDSKNVVKV
jgi:hypothetical protein